MPKDNKMLTINIRLWTNQIAENDGKLVPKHAWDAGVISIESNGAHGIKSMKPIPFHGLHQLQDKLRKVLADHEIVLHIG